MFKRILVPLDMSDKHKRALGMAAELAKQSQGAVFLFHVVESIPGLKEDEEEDFYTRLEAGAVHHLNRYARTLEAQGISCHQQVMLGHRVPNTTNHAKKIKADLIILTAPPFDAKHPVGGLGSMSWKISMLAPCPVLLVK